MAMNELKTGHIVEVIGPVVDIQFEEGHLPFINNAVRITSEGFNNPEPLDIVAEVAQMHGAALSIDAGPAGKGTSVRLSFPQPPLLTSALS